MSERRKYIGYSGEDRNTESGPVRRLRADRVTVPASALEPNGDRPVYPSNSEGLLQRHARAQATLKNFPKKSDARVWR